jgi:hypothetical protein
MLQTTDVTNPEAKQKLTNDIEQSNTMLEKVQTELKQKEQELVKIEKLVEVTASNVDFVTDNSQEVAAQLKEAKDALEKEQQEVASALDIGKKELALVQQEQVEPGAVIALENQKQQDITDAKQAEANVNKNVVEAEMEDLNAPLDPNLTPEQRAAEKKRRENKKKKLRQKANKAAKSASAADVEGKRQKRTHKKVHKKSPKKHRKNMSHKKGKRHSHRK